MRCTVRRGLLVLLKNPTSGSSFERCRSELMLPCSARAEATRVPRGRPISSPQTTLGADDGHEAELRAIHSGATRNRTLNQVVTNSHDYVSHESPENHFFDSTLQFVSCC